MLPFCFLFYIFLFQLQLGLTDIFISDMPKKIFKNLRDVNLGAMFRMSEFSSEKYACMDKLTEVSDVHLPQVRLPYTFLI